MAAIPEEVRMTGMESSTSVAEMVAGGAAVILAILGLAHSMPTLMTAIATVAVGLAVMFAGASITAGYSKLLNTASERPLGVARLGGGMSVEIIAGGTGIILGVLALLKIAPLDLSAVAVIVYGSALLFGKGAATRLKDLEIETMEKRVSVQRVAEEAVETAMGAQTLIGVGAIVLGILSLVGIASLVLTLVALLSLGVAIVISGMTLSTNMLSWPSRG